MPEECSIIRNPEGFLVDSCTGEVVGFDNYEYQDYSYLEYYERKSSLKKGEKRAGKEIKDTKEIILNYLLSIMTDEEKEMFYKILQKIGEKKLDAAYYLAIYEYILSKENKTVDRNYLKFLKMKGLGRYAIRQRKKFLGKILKEDPVINFINNEYNGDKAEALKIYELLKKHGIAYGKSETRKKLLLEYLNDEKKKKSLLEKERIEDIRRSILLLNIRDFEGLGLI